MFWHKTSNKPKYKPLLMATSAVLLLCLSACGTTSKPGLTTYVGVDQPIPTCEIKIDPRLRKSPILSLLALQTPNKGDDVAIIADKAISDVELMVTAFDTLDAAISADEETCTSEKTKLAQERAAAVAKIYQLNNPSDRPPSAGKN